MAVLTIVLLACSVSLVAAETQVATFVDGSCQTSQQAFVAVDGYPDGLCMSIAEYSKATYGSFMVTNLDLGCAVTIYGNDTDDYTCSATTLKTADVRVCLDSLWKYISVDGCTNSSTPSNSLSSPTASATSVGSAISSSSSLSAVSSFTPSITSSLAVSSTSSTANGSSTSSSILPSSSAAGFSGTTSVPGTSSGGSKIHTGAIVGGIVGGLAGLAALLGAYIWYRHRHSKAPPTPDQPVVKTDGSEKAELPHCSQVHEMEHPNKPIEAPTGFEGAELGVPIVEMEAPPCHYPRTSFVVNK